MDGVEEHRSYAGHNNLECSRLAGDYTGPWNSRRAYCWAFVK